VQQRQVLQEDDRTKKFFHCPLKFSSHFSHYLLAFYEHFFSPLSLFLGSQSGFTSHICPLPSPNLAQVCWQSDPTLKVFWSTVAWGCPHYLSFAKAALFFPDMLWLAECLILAAVLPRDFRSFHLSFLGWSASTYDVVYFLPCLFASLSTHSSACSSVSFPGKECPYGDLLS